MPLQNRVEPTGEIVAVPDRGLFMGNRGILHNNTKQLQRRRWTHKAWIICVLEFKGRHRPVMTPNRYTELFFFDEAAAVAAGHRPCFECRRQAALDWQAKWIDGSKNRAGDMDERLHTERTLKNRCWQAPADSLPDGTYVFHDNQPHLLLDRQVFPWNWSGYAKPAPMPAAEHVTVITPPSAVDVLRNGYKPVLHPSAGCNNNG